MHSLILLIFSFFTLVSTNSLYPEDHKKIIGLMPMRNEAPIVKQALIALSKITDGIIVLDDCSTDNTLTVVNSIKDQCNILEIIEKKDWYRDESGDKNNLLNRGRSYGGTYFIVIDADEIISANTLESNYLKNEILNLNPGDSISLNWVQLWRSTQQYREDSMGMSGYYKEIIFCDDGCSSYTPSFIHTNPVPENLSGTKKKLDPEYALLHFKFVNWDNMLKKTAWYQCLERIRQPEKKSIAINARYLQSKYEVLLGLKPCPKIWFEGYDFFDTAVYHIPQTWRTDQIRSWFKEYDKEYFKDLDIWNIDWDDTAKAIQFINGIDLRNNCDFKLDGTTYFEPKDVFDGAIIFVQTDYLQLFFSEFRPALQHRYILVTHNCTWPIKEQIKPVLDDERLIAWYAKNVAYNHPKLKHIPSGIRTLDRENSISQQSKAIVNVTYAIKNGIIKKTDLVKKQFSGPITHDSYEEYLTYVAQAAFILCPQFQELDEQSIWEALMVGTIPIVKTSALDSLYMQFPICIIKEWNDLSPDYLMRQKDFLSSQFPTTKLYTWYWINQIKKEQTRAQKKSAVTYEVSDGRLGDHLITCCTAKQIALEHNMPFLYRPFPHADQLALSQIEIPFEQKDLELYDKVEMIDNITTTNFKPDEHVLYIITNKHWQKPEFDPTGTYQLPTTNAFRKLLRNLMRPTTELVIPDVSPFHISIALHIRTGGDFKPDQIWLTNHKKAFNYLDTVGKPIVAQEIMLKFPDLEYYVTELQKIVDKFQKSKLYIFIFTDDSHPELLAQEIDRRIVSKNKLFIDYHLENSHADHVLEDIFAMTKFDVLIRPRSGLSTIAQLIGNHRLVIYPKHGTWKDKSFKIDQVGIARRTDEIL